MGVFMHLASVIMMVIRQAGEVFMLIRLHTDKDGRQYRCMLCK